MNKTKILEILMSLMIYLEDDKIDVKEAGELLKKLLQLGGVPEWQSGRYKIFLEPDGDLHIIINVELLKKLKFEL